jgi:hypothetical protein
MSRAFILSDVEPARMRVNARLMRMHAVLTELGFDAKIIGQDAVTNRAVESFRTQYGDEDAERSVYGHVARALLARAEKGDVIIATEFWHTDAVFRGMVEAGDGKFRGVPVIELWIDYINPASKYRVFATEYHRVRTSIWQEKDGWTEDWIVAYPYYKVEKDSVAEMEIFDAERRQKNDLHHMEAMCKGIPVLAPDWGAWRETVAHGASGILYRSRAARKASEEWVYKMDSGVVRSAVESGFGMEAALKPLRPFFKRLVNA